MKIFLSLILPAMVCTMAQAKADTEFSASGEVSADSRYFFQAGRYPDQLKSHARSLTLAPAFDGVMNGNNTVKMAVFYRYAFNDSGRTHGDVREAYWRYSDAYYDLTVGLSRVFWGVAESRHLVDIINQSDTLEDVDGEDKLGQPMVNLEWFLGGGQMGLYWLPFFREQPQLDAQSRLRLPYQVNQKATYESRRRTSHQDFAVRYSFVAGDWDIGFAGFYGTSREPLYLVSFDNNKPLLTPYYELMSQVSIDAQLTTGAWLYKLEAIARFADSDDFLATVTGFEYSLYQFMGSSMDAGLILEYLWDNRHQDAPVTAFDNDLFVGTRLAFNDADDTSFLLGIIVDLDTQDHMLSIEAEKRLTNHFLTRVSARGFERGNNTASNADNPIAVFDKDDFIEIDFIFSY